MTEIAKSENSLGEETICLTRGTTVIGTFKKDSLDRQYFETSDGLWIYPDDIVLITKVFLENI